MVWLAAASSDMASYVTPWEIWPESDFSTYHVRGDATGQLSGEWRLALGRLRLRLPWLRAEPVQARQATP